MLLPTMNDAEVNAEVLRDSLRLMETTLMHKHQEYCKERQKLKIDKTKIYPKTYLVRSAAKNTWLIVVHKRYDQPKHRGMPDQAAAAIIYYFAKDGYRFFRTQPGSSSLEMFWGHFFTRYNERMGLQLNTHVEIAAHFFSYSSALYALPAAEKGRNYIAAICKDGIALGVKHREFNWKIYRTFVSHQLKHDGQKRAQHNMQEKVRRLLFPFIKEFKNRPAEYDKVKGIFLQIFGPDHDILKAFDMYSVVDPVKGLPPTPEDIAERSKHIIPKAIENLHMRFPGI